MELNSHYNLTLVLLSIFIAVFSSYTTLDLVNRLMVSKGMIRKVWLLSGACTLGTGIWSMHFVAMLAFHLSIPVDYNVFLVVLSFIMAIISCGIAFFIVSRGLISKFNILIGAVLIGIGIVSMHYIGMAAMEMQAQIEYDPLLWLLSVFIAVVTSVVALYLLFYFGVNANGFRMRKVASSVIMGVAISGMHYTGMAAARFNHHSHDMLTSDMSINNTVLAYFIGIGTFVILGFILISIYVDRKFEFKSSQLELSDNRYQSLIDSAIDAIIVANESGNIITWNKGAEMIFGYKQEEILGEPLDLIIPERYRESHRIGLENTSTNVSQEVGKTIELFGQRKNGQEFPLELSLATWRSGEQAFFSSIIRDITERKQAEEKINQLIYRDSLTKLPNRRLFKDHLNFCLGQANLNKKSLAVIFIDLDRFKNINDNFGHGIGDRLLIEAANRMEGCIGTMDMLARQSGDEFICVFLNADHQQAAKKVQNILDEINRPFLFDQHEIFISASIGISMYPSDGVDGGDLIKHADAAMYRVKVNGRNHFQFYTADMNDWISKKMKLEYGLRRAIERQEFVLYFQPQMDVSAGEIKGVEALIRWNHPEWGIVSPAEFIPLAEETGLIIPIGKWVIKTACLQAMDWQRRNYPPIRMAINISARQFQQKDFVDLIRKILEETELEPQYLDLELTESIVQDPEHALPILEELKSMGIMLSLDDFGTGYSSLSYLKQFPLDTLKIDQSFIRTVTQGSKDAAIVRTIIQLATSLNLKVIAEGVETDGQLDCLKRKQCDEFQGYLYSRPVPSEEMERMMKNSGAFV